MSRLLTIHPPLAGIVRGRGLQKQPPYSCRESVNFVPQFPFDGSESLAIRPPMAAFDTPGTTVNLLARVNGTTADTPQRTLVAGQGGTLYRWTGAAFAAVGGTGTIPTGRAAFAQAFEQKVYIPAATPLVYDYPSDTLSTWTATAGTVPASCRIIVYWAGGLWLAQNPDEPHIVSGCRTGDPLDFDFNEEDEGAAFSTIGDNAGLISDPVTALIPIDGDSMIVSGPDSMQIWRGHPRRGGVADILSQSVGVRGQGAWTQGPDGTIYAVTNKGFVAIQGGRTISPISEDRIPAELIGFDYDYTDPRICVAYDAKFNAVHITVRGDTLAESEAWWYDIKNGGLFQIELAAYPHVMLRFDPIGTGRASEVLLGGAGYGGLAHYNLDGSESISTARIVIGPMKLTSSPLTRANIQEAVFNFGGGTDAVSAIVGLYCGPTLDSSYASATSGDGAAKHVTTIDRIMASQGRIRPMCAGHGLSVVVELAAAATNPKIVFEEATLMLADAGKERGYVMHSDTSGPRAGSFRAPGPDLTDFFAAYNLSEASGTRDDMSVNALDLSLSLGDAFSNDTGKSGNGMALTAPVAGANSLESEASVSMDPDLGITIAAWVKHDPSADTDFTSFGCLCNGGDDIQGLEAKLAASVLRATLRTDAGDIDVDHTGSPDFSDAEFHLVVAYYDPATATVGIGFDNSYVTGAAGAHNGIAADALINVQINAGSGDGVIDELYIWNRYIGVAGRQWLWNSGAGRFAPSFT